MSDLIPQVEGQGLFRGQGMASGQVGGGNEYQVLGFARCGRIDQVDLFPEAVAQETPIGVPTTSRTLPTRILW